MNKIFKTKKSSNGQTVVTSELAKNKNKASSTAALLLSSLLATSAIATPVSVLGTATSENAVAVGDNSYATAVDGVANGQGAIATGRGFSREDFQKEVDKVAELEAQKQAKENLLNSLNNDKKINEETQKILNNQISDADKKIASAADKIAKVEDLTAKKQEAENNKPTLNQNVQNSQNALDAILKEGKNVYLDFVNVLNSLDWKKLNGTDEARNVLAGDLKTIVETDFADLAGKYNDAKYRELIDGFINKQAAFSGSVEKLKTDENNFYKEQQYSDKVANELNINSEFVKGVYAKTNLSESGFFTQEDATKLKTAFEGNRLTHKDESFSLGQLHLNSTQFGLSELWALKTTDFAERRANYGDVNYDEILTLSGIFVGENAYLLNELSRKLDNTERFLKDISDKKETNTFQRYLNTALLFNSSKLQNENSYLWGNYGVNFSNFENTRDGLTVYSFKTLDNNRVAPMVKDGSLALIRKLAGDDNSADSLNVVTPKELENFNTYYNYLNSYYDNIDWNDANSVYDLTSYKAQLDSTKALANAVKAITDNYNTIIAEKAKANPDQALIDRLTAQIIEARGQLKDLSNYSIIDNYRYVEKADRAKAELEFSKEFADKWIAEANHDLKLYQPNDSLVVDVTNKAKELQDALDKAKEAVLANDSKIQDLNNQIRNLGLTPEEEGAVRVKENATNELANAKNQLNNLEQEINRENGELDSIKNNLANSSLKDLGLHSIATGHNAFASGDNSIAIGANTTVTAEDGIGIGRENTVDGSKSIAIGSQNNISHTSATDILKAIAIGNNNTVQKNGAISIGSDNVISHGNNGENAIALGNNVHSEAESGIAIGQSARVDSTHHNAVVLGASSESKLQKPVASITLQDTTYNFAGSEPVATVSVGKSGFERQIVNVGAGEISETSTDAINGSQLHAVVSAVKNLKIINMEEINSSIDSAKTTIETGDGLFIEETVNEGGGKHYTLYTDKTTVSTGSGLAVKTTSKKAPSGATVTDYEITLTSELQKQIAKEESIASGSDNIIVTQDGTNDTGGKHYLVKLSDNIKLGETGSLEVGKVAIAADKVDVGGNVISNLKSGVERTDAATVGQLQDLANASKTEIKEGKNIKVATSTGENGQPVYTVSVASDLEEISTISNDNTKLTLKEDGVDVNGGKITNVKPAEISENSTDVVTGSQLYTTNKKVEKNAGDIEVLNNATQQIAGNVAKNAKDIATLTDNTTRIAQQVVNNTQQINNNSQAIKHLNEYTTHLNNKIDNVDKRARKGTAIAGAMGILPQPHLAGKSMVSAATTNYRGEQALAVGYSRLSDNSKHIIKLSGSSNLSGKKDVMVGASYGYQW